MIRNHLKVLITGAQGFLGRYLVADWLAADPVVSIIGVGRSARLDNHFTHSVHWGEIRVPAPMPPTLVNGLRNSRYAYRTLDVTDTAALRQLVAEHRPDLVVHLAAALRDDPPSELVAANIGGVVSVLESLACLGASAPPVLFGSSGSIYGSVPDQHLPLSEDRVCAPIDPYSATKRAAEELGRILANQFGVPALWARIFNPVGPGQDERHLCGWLGRQVAAIAGGARAPLISVGPLHTTRDFIDVRDTARALRLIATRGEPGLAYNVAAGRETSGRQILETLLRVAGLADRVTLEIRPGRSADIDRVYADRTRLDALGDRPCYAIEESLAAVLAYYADFVAPSCPDEQHCTEPRCNTPANSLDVLLDERVTHFRELL